MNYYRTCEEIGCKKPAEFSIAVALRSTLSIAPEVSRPIGFVCSDHKGQTMDEFIPQTLWDKLVESKRSKYLPMPIKTVSYLVILP